MKEKTHMLGGVLKVGLITVALLTTAFSINVLATGEHRTDVVTTTYSFPSPSVSKISVRNVQYDQILLKGSPCSGNPGEPLLPTKGVYLLLPPHSTVEALTISGEKTLVGSGFNLIPCGKPIPIIESSVETAPEPDKELYGSHDLFPGRLFSEVGVHQFRGYSILVLQLYPVQYIPSTGDLYYYPTMTLTITLQEEPQSNSLYRSLPADRNELVGKIQNPSMEVSYADLEPRTMITDQFDLLIVTTDDLKNGFLPLAEQHNLTGTRTLIRTLSDIGGTTAEDIRSYLQTTYATLGIRYVLLGGDADVIPAKMLWVEGMDENVTLYETFMPSDLYYACLDGTYNYDGDEKWGEPDDGDNGSDVDLIAEVYVGRACVGTIEEVEHFVSKTVDYLSLTPNETYLGDVTFAGEHLGDYGIASYGGAYLDQMINGSSDDGYTTVGIPADVYRINKLYDAPGYSWPKSEIISLISDGVHIINHLGHAYYEYDMKMDTDDVSSLTNTNNFCFIYSQGCMAGGFDNPQGNDCIAEYFTAKNNHGAFAGIWNARYGFFWSYSTDGDSQRFHRQFWDAVFGENIKELGRANHDSKEDNLFLIQRSCMRWVYYETNLFGDPAVAFLNTSGLTPKLRVSGVEGGRGLVKASVLNEGEVPVNHIPWKLFVTGGFFGFINSSSFGSLETLAIGNTSIIQPAKSIFGFGKISIQVTVKYAEDWHGSAFVFGPFVLRVVAS
jgi:hypothetical protein